MVFAYSHKYPRRGVNCGKWYTEIFAFRSCRLCFGKHHVQLPYSKAVLRSRYRQRGRGSQSRHDQCYALRQRQARRALPPA